MQRSFKERFTSRPFLLALIGALGTIAGNYFNAPPEVIAIYTAPLVAFIVGESYRDGKAASAPNVPDTAALLGEARKVAQKTAIDQVAGQLGFTPSTPALRDGLVIDDGPVSPYGNPNAEAVMEQERAFNGND